MNASSKKKYPIKVLIVAIPETAGSALYGMLDVLKATGNLFQTLLRSGDGRSYFDVHIVSPDGRLFTCGNSIPVNPDCSIHNSRYHSYRRDGAGSGRMFAVIGRRKD